MPDRKYEPRDFVIVRVSKKRWRIAVLRLSGEKLQADYITGKFKSQARAAEALKTWNNSAYGIQYGEYAEA